MTFRIVLRKSMDCVNTYKVVSHSHNRGKPCNNR